MNTTTKSGRSCTSIASNQETRSHDDRHRENLVARYCAEFRRTNGLGCQVEYRAGWFVVNGGTLVRLAEFERMVATLESRPTKQEVTP